MSFYPVFQVISTSCVNTSIFAFQYIDIPILLRKWALPAVASHNVNISCATIECKYTKKPTVAKAMAGVCTLSVSPAVKAHLDAFNALLNILRFKQNPGSCPEALNNTSFFVHMQSRQANL